MAKVDVLLLHGSIINRFDKEIAKLDDTKITIKNVTELSESFIEKLTTIYDATIKDKNIFMLRTNEYVNEYKNLLKIPFNKLCSVSNENSFRKNTIETVVSAIALDLIFHYKWFDIKLIDNEKRSLDVHIRCFTCNNECQNDFEVDENNKKICLRCSREINTIETGHTHQDYNRVNIISKFVHNRVLHLQECIKQFQGKQNCKISETVYADLTKKFKTYRLLIDSDNYHVVYSKITPQHISIFLKELGYVKHYKNVNAIYYALTNKRVADISHLEHKLIEDFKELVALYNSLHTKDKPDELQRKNFMNVHYLLFQLLKRHGYSCKIDDFSMLKTIDRKIFHDKICGNLFEKLGWNFTPIF